MSISNVKSFTKAGRADVFLLDPNGSYQIATIGALGGASDVHIWVATVDVASNDDPTLTDNWTLAYDSGASGEASGENVAADVKKLFIDVINGTEGVVFTLTQSGALSGAGDKSQGLLSANNQRQKFSSQVRRLN